MSITCCEYSHLSKYKCLSWTPCVCSNKMGDVTFFVAEQGIQKKGMRSLEGKKRTVVSLMVASQNI